MEGITHGHCHCSCVRKIYKRTIKKTMYPTKRSESHKKPSIVAVHHRTPRVRALRRRPRQPRRLLTRVSRRRRVLHVLVLLVLGLLLLGCACLGFENTPTGPAAAAMLLRKHALLLRRDARRWWGLIRHLCVAHAGGQRGGEGVDVGTAAGALVRWCGGRLARALLLLGEHVLTAGILTFGRRRRRRGSAREEVLYRATFERGDVLLLSKSLATLRRWGTFSLRSRGFLRLALGAIQEGVASTSRS